MSRQSRGIPFKIDNTEVTATATELNLLDGVTATTTELNLIDGYSGTTAELSQLSGTILTDMTAGTGITAGALVIKHSVTKIGGLFKTEILIDLTGLNSGDTSGDVIGNDGAAANCHFGQILAAVNGTIIAAEMTCHQLPVTGDIDLDLWYADDATLAQDTAISAATNEQKMIDSGDWTAGATKFATKWPPTTKYLYIAKGADVADADWTAGVFVITLWGH